MTIVAACGALPAAHSPSNPSPEAVASTPRPTPRQVQNGEDPEAVSAAVAEHPPETRRPDPVDEEDVEDPARIAERLRRPARRPWLFRVGAPKQFASAVKIFDAVERMRRSGRATARLLTRCPNSPEPTDWLLVKDERGRLRELIEEAGSEDSAETLRYFLDESGRMRLLYVERADVSNGEFEWVIALDEKGAMIGCHMKTLHPGMASPNLCEDEADEPPEVDAAVRSAVRPPVRKVTPNSLRTELLAIDLATIGRGCRSE